MSGGDKITRAVFGGLRSTTTANLWQYDYGQVLLISGIDLPDWYEVHFANQERDGEAKGQIGDANGVAIPDECLTSGEDIFAFLFLHDGETDGETEYKIHIPVKERPLKVPEEPTPVQQDMITEALAALTVGVNRSETAAANAEESEANAKASEEAADAAMQAASGSAQEAAEAAANAAQAAQAAAQAAQAAGQSEASAGQAATDAQDAAADAARSADRAEQAATTAGYLDIDIDPVTGRLIYIRTDQVDVDFVLRNEHLIMEVI